MKDFLDATSAGQRGLKHDATKKIARITMAKIMGTDAGSLAPADDRAPEEVEVLKPVIVLPTFAKERTDMRKEKGTEVNKRNCVIEEHYDDCGKSLAGFGKDAEVYLAMEACAESDDQEENDFGNSIHYHMFLGSERFDDKVVQALPTTVHQATCLEDMVYLLRAAALGHDVTKFCGGEARVSYIRIRRHLTSCGNWDLVTS